MTHDMREENDSKDREHLRNQRGQKTVDQRLQSAERPRTKQGLYIRKRLECRLITNYGFRSRKWDRNPEISIAVGLRNKKRPDRHLRLAWPPECQMWDSHTRARISRVQELINKLGAGVEWPQLQERAHRDVQIWLDISRFPHVSKMFHLCPHDSLCLDRLLSRLSMTDFSSSSMAWFTCNLIHSIA